MEWTPPRSWRKVSREEFEQATGVVSWYRDNRGNAVIYFEGWNDKPFAAKILDSPKHPTYYLEK
jgi:hypothetical protein